MNNPFMNTIERLPIDIVGGAGSHLIDATGKAYLDFWGDEGVASLGYCSPEVNGIFERFAKGLSPHRLPDAYPNKLRTAAAAQLCEVANFDRAFFCNSGAEANEAAIKLARRYWSVVREQPDRFDVLTVAGNFHGRTGYALAASDSRDSMYHKDGYGPSPLGFGVIEDDLDINNISRYKPEDMLNSHKGKYRTGPAAWGNVAAIIMAPILGNNTVKTYPKEFWERLNALRQEHGFLLIFDEVQVATGRTGTFCAHQNQAVTHGVRPDIICIGKGIAAGIPAATVLADNRVADAFVPGVHFSTFGASMLVCEAMLTVMEWFQTNGPLLKLHAGFMRGGFSALKQSGLITAFDGAGLHWGFTPDWERLNTTGPEVIDRARDFGLLMLTHRPKAPIRFTPPLNISTQDLQTGFQALRQTLESFNNASSR